VDQSLDAKPDGAMVVSVNIAEVREIPLRGRLQKTGLWKVPVHHRVRVAGTSLDGDTQADRKFHGGARKAVYSYSEEDYAWWEEQLVRKLDPGTFGENLTLRGISVNDALIGERWRIGSALLEVTQPRQPCWKLGVKMEDRNFPRRFSEANRSGAYLRIVEEGEIGPGDPLEVEYRPDHPITIGLLAAAIYTDPELAALLIQLTDHSLTPEEWIQLLE
jgi:MOSC domain-containing protein YiiM